MGFCIEQLYVLLFDPWLLPYFYSISVFFLTFKQYEQVFFVLQLLKIYPISDKK